MNTDTNMIKWIVLIGMFFLSACSTFKLGDGGVLTAEQERELFGILTDAAYSEFRAYLEEALSTEEIEEAQETSDQPNGPPDGREVVEKAGRQYKWVGDRRYQKHPTDDKWLEVDDRGNWIPLLNTTIIKFEAHGGGRSVVVVQNNIFEFHVDHDDPNALTVNGVPWPLKNDHANGGRGHYYGPPTNGPCHIVLRLKDGSTREKNVPAGSMRTDRPEPGANWRWPAP